MKTNGWRVGLMTVALAMLAGVAGAATPYYVDDANGDDGNNGESWAAAKQTIQAAVDLTTDGDTVWVTNGTYNITAQISITNGITVRSVNGRDVTTVRRDSGNTRVLYIDHADATLEGFTVTNGNLDNHGAGIYLNAGTVSSCRITGNTIPDYKGRHGAGMYVGAAGVVSNSVIVGNTADRQNSGGGIFLDGGIVRNSLIATNTTGVSQSTRGGGIYSTSADSLVENSIIRGNTCGNLDGGGFYGRGTLRNCLIVDNTAQRNGGGVFAGMGTLVIENCTIADNYAQVVGGGVHRSHAHYVTLTIRNSIVYGNTSGGDSNPNYGDGTFSYSCAIPLPAGDGNTAADPLFVDPEAGDYRVRPGSSAINNAETLGWMSDAVDLEGNNRILGDGPDIGAYEFVAGGALQMGFVADTPKGPAPLTATFTVYVSGDDLSGLSYAWDFENTGDNDTAGADKDVVAHDYPAGRYSVRLTVTTDGESAELVRTGYIIASPAQLYVATDGLNQAPYTNWTDAATTVQAALELAGHGSRITVSNGLYNVATRNLVVNEAIMLESANGSDYTTLRRSSGTTRVIYVDHPDAVLDGFTIRDGANVHGAGVYLNKGTVQNCVIRNNTIGNYVYPYGGGMAVAPGGVVSNCLITANSVGADSRGAGIWLFGGTVINSTIVSNSTGSAGTIHGGGIFSTSSESLTLNSFILDNACQRHDGGGYYGSGTLRNCLIAGNTAARNGGGVFASGTLIIENCTISENHAVGTGGGTQGGTIKNSIIYGNIAPANPATDNYSGGTFTYSLSTPKPDGDGNIEDDPLFVDSDAGDYRLQVNPVVSPAIDAGTPPPSKGAPYEGTLAWINTAVDLAGQPRYANEAVDMGAYEMFVPPKGSVIMLR